MFYDERINAECGKMYRTGIILTTILTAVYGCMRAFYLRLEGDLRVKYLLLELIVVVGGLAILLVGSFLYGRHLDERVTFNKYRYYRKFGPLFLIIVISACIIAMLPSLQYSDHYISSTYPGTMLPNAYIALFASMGCAYFFFHFKMKDISVNYLFIEESHYYRRVFINIAKVAVVLLLAVIFLLLIVGSFLNFSHFNVFDAIGMILFYYPIAVFVYALGHLYISWLEYRSYHYPNGKFVKNERLISLIIALIVEVYIFFFSTFGYKLYYCGMIDMEMLYRFYENLDILMLTSFVLVSLGICSIMAKVKKNKMVVIAVQCFIVLHSGNVILNYFLDFMEWNCVAQHFGGDFGLIHTPFYKVRLYIAKLPIFIDLAFLWLIICGMIKNKRLSKPFIIAPIVQTLLLPLTWQLCVYAQNYLWHIARSAVVNLQGVLTLATLIPVIAVINKSPCLGKKLPGTEAIDQIE